MKDMLLKLWIKAQILREENGQDMVEYALVVGIIALGCTAAMQPVATSISAMWDAVKAAVDGAAGDIKYTPAA